MNLGKELQDFDIAEEDSIRFQKYSNSAIEDESMLKWIGRLTGTLRSSLPLFSIGGTDHMSRYREIKVVPGATYNSKEPYSLAQLGHIYGGKEQLLTEILTNFCPYTEGIIEAVEHILRPYAPVEAQNGASIRSRLKGLEHISKESDNVPRRCTEGFGRLLVVLPPRHGKQETEIVVTCSDRKIVHRQSLSAEGISWVALVKGCSYTVTSIPSKDQFVLVYDLTTGITRPAAQHYSFIQALEEFLKNDPEDMLLGVGLEFDYIRHPNSIYQLVNQLRGSDDLLANSVYYLGLKYDVASVFVYPEEGKQVITSLDATFYDFSHHRAEDKYESMGKALPAIEPPNLHWIKPPRRSGNGPAVKFTSGSNDGKTFEKKSCSVLLIQIGRG